MTLALPHICSVSAFPQDWLEDVEKLRQVMQSSLGLEKQAKLGQYTTPVPLARWLATFFTPLEGNVRLLDAGAGTGVLSAAFVDWALSRDDKGYPISAQLDSLSVDAIEIDLAMYSMLEQTLTVYKNQAQMHSIPFKHRLHLVNFINWALLQTSITHDKPSTRFTHIFLNPPYSKISRLSLESKQLSHASFDSTNLYTAFLDLAIELLEPNGQLLAIVPRSFMNGPYYRTFRQRFLKRMALERIHAFDSRKTLFKDSAVLQENVIILARKSDKKLEKVIVSSSQNLSDPPLWQERLYNEVVHTTDPEGFIRLIRDDLETSHLEPLEQLKHRLTDLRLSVSTGKVVDFRCWPDLRNQPEEGTVPLIYPANLERGTVVWPRANGKMQAISRSTTTRSLLVLGGNYVLVKRFSAKEERRRVTPAVYEKEEGDVGFENHLNYFHAEGKPLERNLAYGLCAYLASTRLDLYFRQFSGHTQVNATDLRSLPYPSREALEMLGQRVPLPLPEQTILDSLVDEVLFKLSPGVRMAQQAHNHIDEALKILQRFDLPRESINERSALTLLALLGLKPEMPWNAGERPLVGITPLMEFFRLHYGKSYAPNTRETVRRQTVHHFLREALVQINPDNLKRPTNSAKTVYQLDADLYAALILYGQSDFEPAFEQFMSGREALKKKRELERQLERIPVEFGNHALYLSPGGQNPLIRDIIEQFCPRFAPGAEAIYIGDTESKTELLYRSDVLEELGLSLDEHGKMPDVIVYSRDKNWLFLIEAVTSHGPVSYTRISQLKDMFSGSSAGLVFVTAFPNRQIMRKYLTEIAWKTEVWVAEAPDNLIHFDGERFLGPYEI